MAALSTDCPELDVTKIAPIIPLITRYLSFKDRIALEGTNRVIRRISINDGWQDVKNLNLVRSTWTTERSSFYRPSLNFVELVLSRLTDAVTTLDLFAYTGNQARLFKRICIKPFPMRKTVNLQRSIITRRMVTYLNDHEHLEDLSVGAMTGQLEEELRPTWKRLSKIRVVANYHTTG